LWNWELKRDISCIGVSRQKGSAFSRPKIITENKKLDDPVQENPALYFSFLVQLVIFRF